MPGYEILEECYLQPYRKDGVAPHETRIGMLDFLRELKGGLEGISRGASFRVVGLEEVLYQAGPEGRRETALAIRKVLQGAAQIFNRKLLEVQIVCKGKLVRGDALWLEYRGEKLPVDFIFGTPTKQDIHGCPVYSTGFNLSS
jgi:hypothetical protein